MRVLVTGGTGDLGSRLVPRLEKAGHDVVIGTRRPTLPNHTYYDLEASPDLSGFDVVVHGHSHKPSIERRNGVTYLNPGSCGPRRFRLPVSVARIEIRSGRAECTIVELSGAENR